MRFLPDTNVWINHLKYPSSPLTTKLIECAEDEVFLCDIVKAELFYGAFKSSNESRNLAVLEKLFNVYESLPFEGRSAMAFGSLRAKLAQKGSQIGPFDLQIAAIAIVNNCTLVTHNTREFLRLPGLQVVDWEAS